MKRTTADVVSRTAAPGQVLLRQHEIAWQLASHHFNGLDTPECLWRPATR